MPDWSIKIVPNTAAVAGQPGAFRPQQAHEGDIVSWNNTTGDWHQPWPTDKNYVPLPGVTSASQQYLSDNIPPGTSSDAYSVILPADFDPATNTGTIFYRCQVHPDEHGTITVIGVKTPPPAPPPSD
jgi:hypothetical protein